MVSFTGHLNMNPWRPGRTLRSCSSVFLEHRLGGKPVFKEGGMLGSGLIPTHQKPMKTRPSPTNAFVDRTHDTRTATTYRLR
jgi:hypothetical protein